MLSDTYRQVLKDTHADNAGWGKGGTKFFHTVNSYIEVADETILDYGCGKGMLVQALAEANPDKTIIGYDPAVPEYSAPVQELKVDFIVCTDVLEHIEPEYLDATLYRLSSMADRAYYVACHVPAVKELTDGRNAHLIVEDHTWWLNKLLEHYPMVKVLRESRTTSEYMCYGD